MIDQEKEPIMSEETEVQDQENNQEHIDITKYQQEIEQLHEKLLRSAAETENMRRRYEKQIEEAREYSVVSFAKDLISVIDNLSMALEHQPKDLDTNMQNFVKGVELTKSELIKVFAKHGIEEVSPLLGDKFDYNLHHAISHIETADYVHGTVFELMQYGYKIKDRLLRPAAVSVTKLLER